MATVGMQVLSDVPEEYDVEPSVTYNLYLPTLYHHKGIQWWYYYIQHSDQPAPNQTECSLSYC